VKTIVLKPGSTQDQADPGLEPGRVEKKQGKEKPGMTQRPGQKLGCNLLTFFFLLKQRRFDFFFKKN